VMAQLWKGGGGREGGREGGEKVNAKNKGH